MKKTLHCKENHIFFFQTSWKDGLPKKIALEYDLSCIIGKDHVSFSQKYDLIPWTENERWSFSKKYTEIWYFLKSFWKDGLFKKGWTGTWSFLYYLERWYFFPENMIFFPWAGSERWPFSRNTWKYDIFCVHVQVYKRGVTPLYQKKSKMALSRKYTPKCDWRSGLTS